MVGKLPIFHALQNSLLLLGTSLSTFLTLGAHLNHKSNFCSRVNMSGILIGTSIFRFQLTGISWCSKIMLSIVIHQISNRNQRMCFLKFFKNGSHIILYQCARKYKSLITWKYKNTLILPPTAKKVHSHSCAYIFSPIFNLIVPLKRATLHKYVPRNSLSCCNY